MNIFLIFIVVILVVAFIERYLEFGKNMNNKYVKTKNEKIEKGNEGENAICRLIENNIHTYYKIVRNVYIPINDKKTEIDIILITATGIFVIESKNFSGAIYGKEQDYNWTEYFSKFRKNPFMNPIKQNDYHINFISQYLSKNKEYFKSYIVFGRRSKLVKIEHNKKNVKVLRIHQIISEIIDDMHKSDIIFSHEEIDKIYIDLQYYCEHSNIYNND